MYIPLRRPLGNSPTVWESVRSNTTTFALIFLGLWPDWWKKTWLIITFWTNTDDNNKYIPIPNTPYHAMQCQTKVCCLYTQLTKTCILKTPSQPQLSQNTATCTSLHAPWPSQLHMHQKPCWNVENTEITVLLCYKYYFILPILNKSLQQDQLFPTHVHSEV